MGKRNAERNPVDPGNTFFLIWTLCILTLSHTGVGGDEPCLQPNTQEICFSHLVPRKHLVPPLPVVAEESLDQFKKRIEDLKERRKIHWAVHYEPAPASAGCCECATTTIIDHLVENSGLQFNFVSSVSGSCTLEVKAPRSPLLGGFELQIGNQEAGIFDAWAPDPAPPRWYPLSTPVRVQEGTQTLTLFQRSPLDAGIHILCLRLSMTHPFRRQ